MRISLVVSRGLALLVKREVNQVMPSETWQLVATNDPHEACGMSLTTCASRWAS